jgi:hypothetical protein
MRRRSSSAVVLVFAAGACETGSSPGRKPSSFIAESPPQPPADMRGHMAAHLDAAAALQAAIAQGRLGDAREVAAWFATHDMDVSHEWRPFLDEMRYAALRVRQARDLPTAGLELGRIARACGACHVAMGARPRFAPAPMPVGDPTQMVRHQWAAARLWEGLVGPDDARWRDGAHVMTTARFAIGASVHGKPNADVIELGEGLHAQAREALSTTGLAARAKLYGAMMDTCASCHAIVRPHALVNRSEP